MKVSCANYYQVVMVPTQVPHPRPLSEFALDEHRGCSIGSMLRGSGASSDIQLRGPAVTKT